MRAAIIFKILGLLLMLYSVTLLPPTAISFMYHDQTHYAFLLAFCIIAAGGFLAWAPVARQQHSLRTKDGFIVVFLFWVVLSAAGAIPFMLAHHPNLSMTDAFFEAVSGITATGSTVLTGIDYLPPAVLWYRQQLQFLGGMGIIVLAVAILPMLGIGGMQLFRAEVTGPTQDTKLTPRLAQTAKALWLIYVGLTILCAIAYYIFGMSGMDAILYAFSTIATGGFAPHDASMGFYPQNSIRIVAMIFMFLGAISFPLHFNALRQKSLRPYAEDPEFRFFGLWLLLISLLVVYKLIVHHIYTFGSDSFLAGFFHAISFSTTGGFVHADYYLWPAYIPFVLLLLGTFGGSAGSTSGGIKMIRVLLLLKQSNREIKKLIHPNGHFSLKFGNTEVQPEVMNSVWAFVAIFVAIYIFLTMLLLGTGVDLVTAFSTVAASIANIGPALGAAAEHFKHLPDFAKWVLAFTMILGRLELFTVLVLFSRTFWRS